MVDQYWDTMDWVFSRATGSVMNGRLATCCGFRRFCIGGFGAPSAGFMMLRLEAEEKRTACGQRQERWSRPRGGWSQKEGDYRFKKLGISPTYLARTIGRLSQRANT
jgi:hypothetical protein